MAFVNSLTGSYALGFVLMAAVALACLLVLRLERSGQVREVIA